MFKGVERIYSPVCLADTSIDTVSKPLGNVNYFSIKLFQIDSSLMNR